MEEKFSKKYFSTLEVILLVIISLIIGLSIGNLSNSNNVEVKEKKISDEHLQELIVNYEYILNNYYEDIDEKKIINGAIAGMMEALEDPYSMYFDESTTENFSIALDGSYKGIGIQISKEAETGYMLISAVFANSPANEAGLKAGDRIISIDDTLASELSASEFSSIIKNSDKDTFSLKILRDQNEIIVTLNKKIVNLDSVTSKTFEIDDQKVGYIYIGIFANNTYQQFSEALSKLEESKISYLIIDVRGNTGGHLTAVDNILDLFLTSDQIMYKFEQNGKITSIYGRGNDKKNYNILLLGDENSASASEVLISALSENLNSIFIGKKTYGKGTVQELVTLSDGTQYKITVKKWLTPKGNWINDTEGIVPNIEVDLNEKYYQTLDDADDSQLQAALNYIKEEIK